MLKTHSKIYFLIFFITSLTGCVTNDSIKYTQLNPLLMQTPKQVNLIINSYPLKNQSPTVIYAHGCSGLDGAYLDWKNKLNNWGYNVVQPDSNRSRGINSACASRGVSGVSHYDRLEDLLETAKWIKTQPWHTGKIGVIGYSMGAMASLNLAANGGELHIIKSETKIDAYKNTDISAVVAYYPYCRLGHKNATIPTLILAGELDDWTPPTLCNLLSQQNTNINSKIYPGAYHSFDTPGFDQVNRHGFRIKYNAIAAFDAENLTKEFFEKHLKN